MQSCVGRPEYEVTAVQSCVGRPEYEATAVQSYVGRPEYEATAAWGGLSTRLQLCSNAQE